MGRVSKRCNALRPIGLVLALACVALVSGCSRAEADEVDTTYHLGAVATCEPGGDCRKFQQGGWAKPHDAFTWTTRTTAKLKFSLAPVKGPLGLRMRVMGNLDPPEVPCQVVEVFANNRKVALWFVDDADDFYAIIPSNVLRPDGKLYVTLKIPRAQPLRDSPPHERPRFGIGCFELEISKAGSVPPHLAVTLPLELPAE